MQNGELGTFCYSCVQVYLCTTKFRAINIFKKKKFTLTGTSPSPSENVWRDGTGPNPVWTCSILIMWTVQLRVQYASNVCMQWVEPGVSSEMVEKLIELARECIKKYSDSVWKEKLWGLIGKVEKKAAKFQLRIWKLLSLYYHRSSNKQITENAPRGSYKNRIE